ncbi:hypothetical protein FHK02_4286 [Spirosoma sp. LMG 31448]|nr:hypothetical protein [Spirosoma utsteinense]
MGQQTPWLIQLLDERYPPTPTADKGRNEYAQKTNTLKTCWETQLNQGELPLRLLHWLPLTSLRRHTRLARVPRGRPKW